MLEVFFLTTAPACQAGQCPKEAAQTVVVAEAPKTPVVTFLTVERPNYRPGLSNLFHRKATSPVVVICPGGKCK